MNLKKLQTLPAAELSLIMNLVKSESFNGPDLTNRLGVELTVFRIYLELEPQSELVYELIEYASVNPSLADRAYKELDGTALGQVRALAWIINVGDVRDVMNSRIWA